MVFYNKMILVFLLFWLDLSISSIISTILADFLEK